RVDQPVVRRQAHFRRVVAEVVVGDGHDAFLVDRDGWQDCHAVARGNVVRCLIDPNRCRPREAAVCGHRKGDAGELEIAEARILPDGVKGAIGRVQGHIEVEVWRSNAEAAVRVWHALGPGYRVCIDKGMDVGYGDRNVRG